MLFHCQTLILPIITAIIVEMPDSILVVKVGSVLNTNPTTINATMNRINLITPQASTAVLKWKLIVGPRRIDLVMLLIP